MTDSPSNTRSRAGLLFLVVLFFFLVSGATGLVYQVVWTRKLVLLFGTTAYAVSTVLAIFFGGLGLGSLIGGRIADRIERPLWLYGLFEIVIGLWAAAFILGINAGEGVVVSVLQMTGSSRAMGIALRAVLAVIFLAVPVTLMGATLPLLARYVTREMSGRAKRIGILYGINTLGAVAGAVSAGFLLIPKLGYSRSTFVAVAANVIVGIGAMVIGRSRMEKDASEADNAEAAPIPFTVLAAFAVSGFSAIALEVVWTRMLVLVFSGTTYAYSTMLASVLTGIAVGSVIVAPLADRVRRPAVWFGIVLILNGAACVAMLSLFSVFPTWFGEWTQSIGNEWHGTVRIQFIIAMIALLPPTLLFGAGFPFAVRAATGDRGRIGADVGRLYSVNTFAGVLGAVAGGFLLIPYVGTNAAIYILGALLTLAGIAVALRAPEFKAARGVAVFATALIAFGGAYAVAPSDVTRTLNEWYIPGEHEILELREGVEGTVAVVQPLGFDDGTDRTIYINRVQATATIERGVRMNRFQAVLPMMFDRDPKDVLFMCFGSGTTLGALAQWDFVEIDAVEISEDVLEVAPYFSVDNLNVLENPRVHITIDDGRNYLLTTPKSYDVITFEPMPLALAGVSTFYTREYYEQCLAHLNEGGIVSQWVPLHSLNLDIVKSLLRTFTETFPHYCVWFINADLFITGSDQPLTIDYAKFAERLQAPDMAAALMAADLYDPLELVTHFVMDQETVDAFVAEGDVMTDDRPWAEFIAPKLIYAGEVGESLEAIQPVMTSPDPILDLSGIEASKRDDVAQAIARRFESRKKSFEAIAHMRSSGTLGSVVEEKFFEALRIDPGNIAAQLNLRAVLAAKMPTYLHWEGDYLEDGRMLLENAVGLVPDEPLYPLLLAQFYEKQLEDDRAIEMYRKHLDLGGTDPLAIEKVGQ